MAISKVKAIATFLICPGRIGSVEGWPITCPAIIITTTIITYFFLLEFECSSKFKWGFCFWISPWRRTYRSGWISWSCWNEKESAKLELILKGSSIYLYMRLLVSSGVVHVKIFVIGIVLISMYWCWYQWPYQGPRKLRSWFELFEDETFPHDKWKT